MSTMDPDSDSTEDVLELEWSLLCLNYASMVVASCWAYDYFLTFSDEVEFLTQSKWTWPKLFYVVCRYFTWVFLAFVILVALQPAMSLHMCRVLYYINTYLGGAIVVCAEGLSDQGVFFARVCAMWEFRRRMMILFRISGAMYVIAAAVVLSLKLASPKITNSPVPEITSCFDTGEGIAIILVNVILVLVEIQIWCFQLYKAASSYWRDGTHNRLLQQLIHHNVIYMTCGLVFSLAAILTTALIKESYGFMIAKFIRIWQVVVHAFLVTKMYRGLWRADRRRPLLESFTFELAVSPEISTQS